MGKIKKAGPLCYAPLVQKIKEMDSAMKDLKMKLDKIKSDFCQEKQNDSETDEICPDEVGSELAMLEIMRNAFIDTVAEEDPEGEA